MVKLYFLGIMFSLTLAKGQSLFEEFGCDTASGEVYLKDYYKENCCSSAQSVSIGTVGNGKLKNGALLPFIGKNFFYFDSASYKCGRAYVNSLIKKTLLETYDSLHLSATNRLFGIMECSKKEGGQIKPHKTHQNGLSVDFMVPKIRKGQPYYGLDSLGKDHYLLNFDSEGRYVEDPSIQIDFDLIGKHLLVLAHFARKNGYTIDKVIFKINLKDDLFLSKYGENLKESGIYFANKLPFIIDILHDDHYHVDFKKIQR